MNGFKFDSPIIKLLTTMANMLIVSFYWLLTSLLIVTIIPSCAALYHTCVKFIFSNESTMGITQTYFDSFKNALKPGILLSVICLIAAFFIYTGLDTGIQIYTLSYWGLAYLILGIVICVISVAGVIYLPAVVSRFDIDALGAIRLSFYLSSINLFSTAWYVLLLAALVYTFDLFPLIIVIMPALYCDLIRVGVEKRIAKFMKDNNITDQTNNKKNDKEDEVISVVDLEKNLEKKKKKNG